MTMTVQGLTRITVSVADLDRALALYRDALGLVEQYRQGDLAMLRSPVSALHRCCCTSDHRNPVGQEWPPVCGSRTSTGPPTLR